MSIPQKEIKQLSLRSGNRCAFADCRTLLTSDATLADDSVILGEAAHIVGQSLDGPRGESPLDRQERDRYENLILLCSRHHQIIDAQVATYTVERLLGIKEDHEKWVERTLGREQRPETPAYQDDTVYSNVLPVTALPDLIFGVDCVMRQDDVKAAILPIQGPNQAAPFILSDGRLWTFWDLNSTPNPFENISAGKQTVIVATRDWASDPDSNRKLVMLLNRCLNKITGRRHLMLDGKHHRYYFQPEVAGQVRKQEYRPLNQAKSKKSVVWEPKSKSSGEGKGYWLHRAVELRFLQIDAFEWCLTIRPGFHVTRDSVTSLPADEIGKRVTRQMARTFNYEWLGEVQFWRDYLSDSSSQIRLSFGSPAQRLVILTHLQEARIAWPGLPVKESRPFKNVYYAADEEAEDPIEIVESEEEQDDTEEAHEDEELF